VFASSFADIVASRIEQLVRRVGPLAQPPGGGSATAARPGLLVALSGGPDSVALLLAALHWSRQEAGHVEAAHLDHTLRGEEARADAEFCVRLCAEHGVTCHQRRFDPRPLARRRGRGLEEAGRLLRRRMLLELIAERSHLWCAATGHHRQDQIETVIMRIFRGTGLDGLRGIQPVAGRLIHPLLEVDRPQILAFLEGAAQPYRLDATNMGGEATRTRIRRELLPLVQDIFGRGADKAVVRLAHLAAQDLTYLEELTGAALSRLAGDGAAEPPAADLPVADLLALDPALAARVLRLHLRRLDPGPWQDLTAERVGGIIEWLRRGRSGSTFQLPGGWRAVREFGRVRFLSPRRTGLQRPETGTYRLTVQSNSFTGFRLDSPPESTSPGWELTCPAAAIQGDLHVRPWRIGDRIALLGLGGHKKLSDLLRERRVGISDRAGVNVVEDEGGILWVPGLARAERTRLLPGQRPTITIRLFPACGHEPPAAGKERSRR
jgi:tRNA(Ile)-lysidine synthase